MNALYISFMNLKPRYSLEIRLHPECLSNMRCWNIISMYQRRDIVTVWHCDDMSQRDIVTTCEISSRLRCSDYFFLPFFLKIFNIYIPSQAPVGCRQTMPTFRRPHWWECVLTQDHFISLTSFMMHAFFMFSTRPFMGIFFYTQIKIMFYSVLTSNTSI